MADKTEKKTLHAYAFRALVLFFVIMMIFTATSRVTASLTTARVTVEQPGERRIEHVVNAEGSVEKNRELAVLTEEGILVKTVYAAPGQKVGEGELLAELDTGHLAELIREKKEELDILRLTAENAAAAEEQSRRENRTAKQRALEDAQNALADAQALYDAAAAEQSSASDAYYSYQSAHTADSGNGEVWSQLLALQDAMKAKQTACDDALRRLRDAQIAAARAEADINVSQTNDRTAAISEIQMAQKERELLGLEELLKAGGTVVSPVEGVVTEVFLAVGQLTPGTAAVTLADISSGMCYRAHIKKEDTAYVSVGAEVTLHKNGQKLEGLTVGAVEPGEDGSFDITVYLGAEAPLSIGDAASLEIRQTSGLYRTVVPVSALHVENGSYYVYVAEEEETVLGMQYQLRRVDVQIEEKNHLYAALSEGTVSSEARIVTDTDRYVEAGSRVRLREP